MTAARPRRERRRMSAVSRRIGANRVGIDVLAMPTRKLSRAAGRLVRGAPSRRSPARETVELAAADRRCGDPRAQPCLARHRQADQRAVVSGRAIRHAAMRRLLGDIVHRLRDRRARSARRRQAVLHHLTHLAVHGFLHLLGYDHETDAEAEAMEAARTRYPARCAFPIPIARKRRTPPDADARQRASRTIRRRALRCADLPVPVRSRARERRELVRPRLLRALFGWQAGSSAPTSKDVLDAIDARRCRLLAGREPDAASNILGAARAPRRRRDGAARRHRRGAAGHHARRTAERVRERRRIRASSSMTIRSTIRSAWSTSAT